MSLLTIVETLIKSVLKEQKITTVQGAKIEQNTRMLIEDVHEIKELDTSLTGLNTLHMYRDLGIKFGTSVTVLDAGGGLKLGTSNETPFTVVSGDAFENEKFEILRWQGVGAGTAKLRIGGVI